MVRNIILSLAVLGLAACESDGGFDVITGNDFGENDGAADGSQPPGAVDSSAAVAVNADTCNSAGGACSGDLLTVRYDGSDLFITGLPFDDNTLEGDYVDARIAFINGANQRGDVAQFVDLLNPQNVSNATGSVLTDDYIAVFATNANVAAGAVRGVDYSDFGYGGAFYQVNSAATGAPEVLAVYNGNYAGIRAFNGQGGLVLTEGTIRLRIDQNPTVSEPVVRGRIDRVAINIPGSPGLTGSPLDDDLATNGLNIIELRDAPIVDGTFAGEAATFADTTADATVNPEDVTVGTYQGTFGGANNASVAGIVVIEGDLTSEGPPDLTDIQVQETGAFIADKEP